jgi:transcriptional regulator with XRE-family HTH domain
MDRRELGGFLRSRRQGLTPPDVGMPSTSRRRTPGLRREEVAALAGMSVDYVTRLEQGRGPQPSDGVLAALARALRLTDDERDYLFRLAGRPAPERATTSRHVRPGVMHLLDRLSDSAAMVVSDTGEVLAWTPLAAALFVDFAGLSPRDRNLFRRFFTTGAEPQLVPEEDRETAARAHLADLRATVARRPGDPQLAALVDELRAASALFARHWDQHDVAVRRVDRKRIRHPVVGLLELDCEVLLTPEHDQRLILHTAPPGSATAQRLELLRVLGTQRVGEATAAETAATAADHP